MGTVTPRSARPCTKYQAVAPSWNSGHFCVSTQPSGTLCRPHEGTPGAQAEQAGRHRAINNDTGVQGWVGGWVGLRNPAQRTTVPIQHIDPTPPPHNLAHPQTYTLQADMQADIANRHYKHTLRETHYTHIKHAHNTSRQYKQHSLGTCRAVIQGLLPALLPYWGGHLAYGTAPDDPAMMRMLL